MASIVELRKCFRIKEEISSSFHYVGTRIQTRLGARGYLIEITMDQLDYVGELVASPVHLNMKDTALLEKKGHREFRRTVGSLMWEACMMRMDI